MKLSPRGPHKAAVPKDLERLAIYMSTDDRLDVRRYVVYAQLQLALKPELRPYRPPRNKLLRCTAKLPSMPLGALQTTANLIFST